MLYFAYGSNMCSSRLRARVSELEIIGPALLSDYRLHCDKRGGDGSAKFSIAAHRGEQVHGALFQLDASARAILDGFEGPGYRAHEVTLQSGGAEFCALTYQALDAWRNAQLLPFDWYLAFTVSGALEQGLPASYVQKLRSWRCRPDPVAERAALNHEILNGARPDLELQQQWPC